MVVAFWWCFFVGFCVFFPWRIRSDLLKKGVKKWGKEHKESNDVFLGVEKSKKKLLKSWHPLRLFFASGGGPGSGTPIEEIIISGRNRGRRRSGKASVG
jgi:hypothetical protein